MCANSVAPRWFFSMSLTVMLLLILYVDRRMFSLLCWLDCSNVRLTVRCNHVCALLEQSFLPRELIGRRKEKNAQRGKSMDSTRGCFLHSIDIFIAIARTIDRPSHTLPHRQPLSLPSRFLSYQYTCLDKLVLR